MDKTLLTGWSYAARDLKLRTQFPSPLQLKIHVSRRLPTPGPFATLLAPSLTKYSTVESTHHQASRLALVAPAKTWVLDEDGRRENTPSHRTIGHQLWCRLPMLWRTGLSTRRKPLPPSNFYPGYRFASQPSQSTQRCTFGGDRGAGGSQSDGVWIPARCTIPTP